MPVAGGRRATIAGLGICVPERSVSNDDISWTLDTSDEWITQRTGIQHRRIAGSGVAASDLAIPASLQALEQAGLRPEEIDLVIVATLTPDHPLPAAASIVAHMLGAGNAGACDVAAGCTGFVYALAMATGMVSSGLSERVLVIGAEIISSVLDWQDRTTAVLFGDGAGAVVVVPATRPGGILAFDLGNDGSGAELLYIPAGGSRMPPSPETLEQRQHYVHMNGREIFRFATDVICESALKVLADAGRSVGDVDLFFPHQANLRIIEAARRRLGIPSDKVYTNLQHYGNTSAASIPMCLAEASAQGKLRQGQLVLMTGFGAGLTWGSCLMEWSGI